MAKQENAILWIIGVILLVAILSQVPLKFPFAVITKTTCVDNTISFWDFDGNVLDANNIAGGANYGTRFIPGKLGQAVEFNTTTYINFPVSNTNGTIMWVKNYSAGDSAYFFLARINGVDYVNTVQSSSKKILEIGPNFGLGFNGSVDIMATFTDLSVLGMIDLYNNGSARNVCYTVSYEENITCKDYATEQVSDPGSGCLNYSGDFFPNCDYEWETNSQYKIANNQCERYFYCQDNPEYTTEQECKENLVYDCYIIQNNVCVKKTDYATCVEGTDYYDNLTSCQEDLTLVTTTPPPSGGTIQDKLSNEVFNVSGYSVKLYHLIILFVAVGLILYFTKKK